MTSFRRPSQRSVAESKRSVERLKELAGRRRELLELHDADRISAEQFAEEDRRLTREIEAVRAEAPDRRQEDLWLDEFVEHVTLFPDHPELKIAGAPRLEVTLSEVGLSGRQSQNVGVRGPSATGAGPSTWHGRPSAASMSLNTRPAAREPGPLVTSVWVSGDNESPPRPTATGGSRLVTAQSTCHPRGGRRRGALSRHYVVEKPFELVPAVTMATVLATQAVWVIPPSWP